MLSRRLLLPALITIAIMPPALAQDALPIPLVAPPTANKAPSGPSAKMAAQLKYYPPNNHLKHYLGEDRYKIAGGVWKYVSTQLDTYYHRASCPNMLKQSPDIVIGIATKADAEESGYRPDSLCKPDVDSVNYAIPKLVITDYLPSASVMKLSDGVSTVTVPAGWRRIESTVGERFGTRTATDTFQRKGSKGLVNITSFTSLINQNLEAGMHLMVRDQRAVNVVKNAASANSPMNGVIEDVKNIKKGKWGGWTAYYARMPVTASTTPQGMVTVPGGTLIFAARGTKGFCFMDVGGGNGANTLMNSFRAR